MSAEEEEAPDPIDPDLPEHLAAIWRWRWLDLIDRMKIPPQRKAVAKVLARFGDPDGTNVFPGEKKVADMANLHETNTRAHIKALVAAGLLCLKQAGGGRGGATNVYRLTRPLDITTLPLWLDADFNRIPAGAQFVPLAPEHRAPAPGENEEHRPAALGETPAGPPNTERQHPVKAGNTERQRSVKPPNLPVDNSPLGETPSVLERNTERFGPEYRAPALPDPLITNTKTKPPAWSPQVSTSPAAKITIGPAAGSLARTPTALAALVGPPDVEPWLPPLAEPARRIVHGAATLMPDPAAYATAHAIVSELHGSGEFFRAAATRELRAAGLTDPPVPAVIVLAAELATRTDPETRTA